MAGDRDIVNGLAIRSRFAFKFVAYTVAVFVVLLLVTLLFFEDTSEQVGTIAGFVSFSFVMGAVLGGLISLGNLFFGNPDSRVSERLLNPGAFAGVVAGGLIALTPFLLDGPGARSLVALASVGLIFASPFSLAFGAILSFKSNYPRLGDFMMGGAIGVLAMIASYNS